MGAGGAQGPRVASGSARFWGGSRLGFGSGMRTDAFSARWQRPTHSERRFGGKNPKNQILPRGVWGRYDARWHTAPQIPPAWGRQRGDGAVALRGRGCPRASVSPRGSSSPPLSPPPLSPAVVTQRGGPRGARGWQSGPRHAGVGTRRCPDGRCPDGRCPMGGGTRPVPPPPAFSRGFIPGFPKNKNKNRQNEMPQKKPQSGAGAQSRGGVPRCAASGCPRTHAAPPAQIHGKLSVCGVPSMGARGVWGRTVTATRV